VPESALAKKMKLEAGARAAVVNASAGHLNELAPLSSRHNPRPTTHRWLWSARNTALGAPNHGHSRSAWRFSERIGGGPCW